MLRLQPLQWPEGLAELRACFEELPPSAPFDAPGWRFVRVPLGQDGPAPYCEVGIRTEGCRITQAAYALPGQQEQPLPGALQGYRWEQGRHGQGYWVLRQAL